MEKQNEDVIRAVWEKGEAVAGYESSQYRKDQCRAWMIRSKHGDRDSDYGWEIDHITPGGSDSLSNLRPLQWENNLTKSDGRLTCPVTANGNSNKKS